MHLDVFDKAICKYINENTALVELGAGYGSKILNLSNKKSFIMFSFLQLSIQKMAVMQLNIYLQE